MDLLKALKRTTILSAAVAAVTVFALGATEADAALGTGAVGHVSCSISTALTISEVTPMSFGNFAPPTGAGTLTLSALGLLTPGGTVPPVPTATGVGAVTASTDVETAAQAPGIFKIVTDSAGLTNVYLSFSDSTGHIIDPGHPANSIALVGPAPASTATDLTVNQFTVANSITGTGYDGTQTASPNTSTTSGLTYGYYGVSVAGGNAGSLVNVGATLNIGGTTTANGQYTGTYFAMVSY